jgi:CHRD domain
MKRIGSLAVVLLVSGVVLATANATRTKNTAICHRTSSASKPYAKLVVTPAQLKRHLKDAADIIPAPKGACPRTLLTAAAGGTALPVALTGEAESPAGDPVATGIATFRLRTGQGQICYQLAGTNLPQAAAAHIHRGAAGVAGPVVVPLRTPDAAGKASGCAVAARTIVASILKSPGSFYANVHTAEFPGGAIRGQLAGSSESAFGWIVAVDLKGSTEPNAKGTAVVRIRKDAGQVCYRLHAESITLPATAAHIHRGAATANGPVVVPFNAPGSTGNSDGCATATGALIDEIIGNPANFYVNVHTTEHPGGAMRAQLG